LAPTKRENWIIFRTLRGHLQDVVDISWWEIIRTAKT
jgi:hypothetical protein